MGIELLNFGSGRGLFVVIFRVAFAVTLLAVSGCASYPDWIASSGPSRQDVTKATESTVDAIRLVQIDGKFKQRLFRAQRLGVFSKKLFRAGSPKYVVGPGDFVEVAIWEAPPATLFGAAVVDSQSGTASARASVLPEQMVAADGTINVPFAGPVRVAGKSPQQIEQAVVRQLTGKANQPQVIVRVTRNTTSYVTVVGEVTNSLRMPLTAKGERLLDAIAAAGGVRQPVNKVTVKLSRASAVYSMPLERVIQSPQENILLEPGDVVTVYFQPLSLTVLGAAGKNMELSFESQGISLAQALARAGGLEDARADAKGIFLFRLENPEVLADEAKSGPTTPEGMIPVVYQLDMTDPGAFLLAQYFPVRDKDVLYVANASSAELQKFLNILTSSIFSINSLVNLGR